MDLRSCVSTGFDPMAASNPWPALVTCPRAPRAISMLSVCQSNACPLAA